MTNKMKEAHKAEAQRKIFEAKKELARLNAEKCDALDRDDREEFKAISKMTWGLNMEILAAHKALEELSA